MWTGEKVHDCIKHSLTNLQRGISVLDVDQIIDKEIIERGIKQVSWLDINLYKRGQYGGQLADHYSRSQFISSGLNWGIYIFVYSQVGNNIHHILGVGGLSMFSSTIVFFSGFC